MPGIYRPTWTALVSNMSTTLVSLLAQQGLPPLTPEIDGSAGAIQIGPQFVAEQGSPPRVLMIPKTFPFENTREVQTPNVTPPHTNPTWAQRAIGLQWKTFEVQCWGCNFSNQGTPAPDPALDYDAAQILAETVWQAAQLLAAGVWRTTAGTIDPQAPTHMRVGRVFVFDLAFSTPAPDIALTYAPNPTTGKATVQFA